MSTGVRIALCVATRDRHRALARSLRLHVVAEGVESNNQLVLLRALGCRQVQGWLTGRPVPVDAFEADWVCVARS